MSIHASPTTAWGCRGRKFKSCRPDLISKQLVAFICGELFLVWYERVTQTMKPNSVSSNGRNFSGCDVGQSLGPSAKLEVTEFKSSRHSRGSSLGFESGSGSFLDGCANISSWLTKQGRHHLWRPRFAFAVGDCRSQIHLCPTRSRDRDALWEELEDAGLTVVCNSSTSM